MSRSQRAQWWNTAVVIVGGVLLSSVLSLLRWHLAAALALVLALVLAWLAAPRKRVTTPQHWDAQQRLVRDGRVIVYWRPGCFFCTRLRLRLGALRDQATWVDIWSDPEAAAFVRDVNGGAETVPTVILPDGEACTNPDPALVRRHLVTMDKAA
ncbi:glutaredoxin domain-containing protein [Mobilicoccus massiliensis]|uniref:glutaredoxin domain-containing protein n=1 Tax=Mobilicoccus massiliensis TaxID=1522310 RepID=UPI001FE3A76F|nr:glutaredoxin domain-containing protein [Mobilicoccus massiliensis]